MEEQNLTKADIDKVRHIEGFPIAKDEDIIALSCPPHITRLAQIPSLRSLFMRMAPLTMRLQMIIIGSRLLRM